MCAPSLCPRLGTLPERGSAKFHSQAISDGRFKLIRFWRKAQSGPPTLVEELYDLVAGVPGTGGGAPQPDYFEQHDLLAAGSLDPEASAALSRLQLELTANYPRLVP